MLPSLGAFPLAQPTPPEYVTKRQFAADRLREMIVAGDLAAGSQVRQQEIAELLGISATPVREAIWQLESEGYLQSHAHIGFRVTQPQVDWFPEVLDLRLDLEGRLARIAAVASAPEEAAALNLLDDQFRRAVEAGDVRETRRVNFRLHKAVWAFARQPITETIVASLWAKFPRTALDRLDERGPQSAAEHHELVLAITARDPARAETAMRHHITAAHGHWRERSVDPPR
ncbi:MAG: GntR family transcriptional regulator [Actinobacteria bacterium]|nr:GntR family transcriptional regulator [Actinomycetota bacterium]